MSDLTAFLLARYAEEEAAWSDGGDLATRPEFSRLARHMLADCEAKRRIVELHHPSTDHRPGFNPYCVGCWEAGGEDGAPSYPCPTLRLLALPYASHPDYRAEWKP